MISKDLDLFKMRRVDYQRKVWKSLLGLGRLDKANILIPSIHATGYINSHFYLNTNPLSSRTKTSVPPPAETMKEYYGVEVGRGRRGVLGVL